jgi:hypothetical protein
VTHEASRSNYDRESAEQQGSSSQQDSPSPDGVSPWRDLAEFARPAIYGRSYVPWLRLTLTLAVLAVVIVALALLLRS